MGKKLILLFIFSILYNFNTICSDNYKRKLKINSNMANITHESNDTLIRINSKDAYNLFFELVKRIEGLVTTNSAHDRGGLTVAGLTYRTAFNLIQKKNKRAGTTSSQGTTDLATFKKAFSRWSFDMAIKLMFEEEFLPRMAHFSESGISVDRFVLAWQIAYSTPNATTLWNALNNENNISDDALRLIIISDSFRRYSNLISRDPTQTKWLKGWLARMVKLADITLEYRRKIHGTTTSPTHHE